jgi:hypothetical protein
MFLLIIVQHYCMLNIRLIVFVNIVSVLITFRSDSVKLPDIARGSHCKFRWFQPEHSGFHNDVWALDDINLNDHLFNTIHVHMTSLDDFDEKLTVTNGKLSDHYCNRMKSIRYLIFFFNLLHIEIIC